MATEPGTLSFRAFARVLGDRSPGYVHQLKSEGRLVLTAGGKRVLVDESLALIGGTADPAKAGVVARHAAARMQRTVEGPTPPPIASHAAAHGDDAGTGRVSSTYQASRAVRERYLAMEAKRAYEVAIGKLMGRDEVAGVVAGAVVILRSSLENLPSRLAPELAAAADENRVRALLTQEIEYALTELARVFATICSDEAI